MRIFFQHIIVLGFVFLLFRPVCSAQQGIITGKILGPDAPLQGATVTLGTKTTLSNRLGEFSISSAPGNYTLNVSYSGFKKITRQIKVNEDNNNSLTLNMSPDEMLGEVVVLGSRSQVQHTNLHTPVPVDVISSNRLLQTGQTTLTQMLQFNVPSFNTSRQLAHEPVTLRGLDPDQVLILVNGKRYHNLSFLNWGGVRGILGRGAVSNDLNSIPFSAIDKIEILKDGAAAQYGSDAIAGVIDIKLKNSIGKTWVQFHMGQFYRGDGETISVGINRGFALFKKGFLNLSGSYRFQNPTYRGGWYTGTVYSNNVVADESIVLARNFDRNKLSNAGSSKHNGYAMTMNGGYPISSRSQLFWTGILNQRTTVFANNHVVPRNVARVNLELFPDGFKSRPSTHSTDIAGIAGVRGETTTQWSWELSSAYGTNRGEYYNKETNNASQSFMLGKNAPTSFYTGNLNYGQLTNNFQLSKRFSTTPGCGLNLAFGAEWRMENYQLKAGEEDSWQNYDTTGKKQGGSGGLVLSPYDEVKANRNVAAAYVDIESEFANRFLIGVAARYEYYNDFGSNLAGKLSARYKLTNKISVRGSVSNGFRAPSLQQRYYSHTRMGFSTTGGLYTPLTLGIFRNNSEVASALGIPSLHAERTVNFSGGFTAAFYQHIRLTIDAYWIQIRDRIVLSGIFDRTNPDVDSLLKDLTDVNQVQFFANAIDTRTKGIEVALNGNWKIKKADLWVMLAGHFTQTRLFGEVKKAGNLPADSLNSNTLFGREEIGKLEEGQPADKFILSVQYKTEKIAFLLRNTRFGKTAILSNNPALNSDEHFSPKILTDISISYSPTTWFTITAGVNNVFDVYPDRLKDYRNTIEGLFIYGQEASPFGFNGGYYFISMVIK